MAIKSQKQIKEPIIQQPLNKDYKNYLEEKFNHTNTKINKLEDSFNIKFNNLEEKIDLSNTKINKVEESVNHTNEKINKLDEKILKILTKTDSFIKAIKVTGWIIGTLISIVTILIKFL